MFLISLTTLVSYAILYEWQIPPHLKLSTFNQKTIMYSHILTTLDLAKNEAILYESLLKWGESAVGELSVHTDIHRRNIYDSLNRLIEKGLVFEIKGGKENKYGAVNPNKLKEKIQEKETALGKIMPDLQAMFINEPVPEAVYIYKGIEGWKNYMQDILDVGEDLYNIGGKGAWADPRINSFFTKFVKEAKMKGIAFHILFDGGKFNIPPGILNEGERTHKFLPKEFSNNSAIDIFGDRVVIFSNINGQNIDENATLTVIVNKNVADSFRMWFKMIWSLIP